MKRKSRLFICILLLFSACSVKTEIIVDDVRHITVHSKKDAIVKITDKDLAIEVNNQGKPTWLEQLFQMFALMFMDPNIKQEVVND